MKVSRPSSVSAWLVVLVLAATLAQAAERTLVVVLDAVPFGTMERLTGDPDEPLFAGFGEPLPLISTFPSSTSIALPAIFGDLGLQRSPGYEARFYDHGEGRRRGGGILSYFRIDFPWRGFFDWNRKGPVRNALHAARPVRAGIREIRRALAAFRASSDPLFTIYVADTDTVAHLFGPAALEPVLRTLDAGLRDLEGVRVVLLSDHGLAGGQPLANVLPAVERRLDARGWRRRQRLERSEDVVLTPYGLVSSFEAYGAPGRAARLAADLAGAEGVDYCVAPLPAETEGVERWRVAAADLTLDFERRRTPAIEWRWRAAGGSNALLAALPEEAAGGWIGDDELLRHTATAAVPDPLHRLAGAFTAVANPASTVCSVAAGYMFGARGTERSARWTKGRLRWTHGALGRAASLGFLMTNRPWAEAPAQGAIRFDRALAYALPPAMERATPE